MLRKRERRLIKRRRISKMRSNYRRQRQIQLKKLLPKQRTLPLSPKKMPLIGRRLPRQPSLKPQKRWLRLKKQPKLRKRCFWPNKRATRKLTMKPSQLKLLPSKRLKNKPKKHRKQLLQLEKQLSTKTLPSISWIWPPVKRSLMPNIGMYGIPDQQGYHTFNSQSTTSEMLMNS